MFLLVRCATAAVVLQDYEALTVFLTPEYSPVFGSFYYRSYFIVSSKQQSLSRFRSVLFGENPNTCLPSAPKIKLASHFFLQIFGPVSTAIRVKLPPVVNLFVEN